MDPDRFAEEKARGLTIDLGFAWTTLTSGRQLALVDVPGHVRFLKNMLAGLGGIDAALFVVAAPEGWKPQSEEHLRILDLLGVRRGLVALTKVGLVDEETVELARLELADAVGGTFLEDAPVVAVDVPTDRGLNDLRSALDALTASVPATPDNGRPRLWVDRVFAAKGSGTVVTGTLTHGALSEGDELSVTPRARRVRVRTLQSLGRTMNEVGPGARVAVNLTGIAHDEIRRGDGLVKPGHWHLSRSFDASLRVLASLDHDVSRRGAYQAYIGSGEYPVRLRVLGAEALSPGSTGSVRIHLSTVLPMVPGDRFILRESGRDETVGGGEVLDVEPILAAAKARPTNSPERLVAERGWVSAEHLSRLTGTEVAGNLGSWVVDPVVLASAKADLRSAIAEAGPLGLDAAALDDRQRAVLSTLEAVVVDGARIRPVGTTDSLVGHRFVTALDAAMFSPPEPDGVDRAELRELVRRGLVVERDGYFFSPAAIEEAARRFAAALTASPTGLTVAQVRDALGTTRKHALPLLAHLDATGVSRRRGDLRFGGPRLPEAS